MAPLRYRHASRWMGVAAVVGSIATGACSLLTSLDGLSNGAGASPDAAPSSSDGGDGGSPLGADTAPGFDAASNGDAGGSRYAAVVLGDQPLLYYRFGEKSGSAARDEVTGTMTPYPITGITYGAAGALAGDPDTAVTTDGSGSLQLTQNADFEGFLPYSVEAWVSPSPAGNDLGFLVDHEAWTDDRGGWVFRASKSDIGFERFSRVPDAGSQPRAVGSDLIAVAGVWHYIVATFDGTSMRIYVDAVRKSTGTAVLGLPKIGVPFAVGKQNCTPCADNSFVGTMDELAIYPKALAEDRILAHYAAAH